MVCAQVRALATLQGGNDIGKQCRTIMRALMTNGLMSKFSFFGQKGKLAFKDTAVFKIILST